MNQEARIYRRLFIFVCIMLFGAVANHLAVTTNDCKMPVDEIIYERHKYAIKDIENYQPITDNASLNYVFLGDILPAPHGAFSIGDTFIVIGILGLVYNLVRLWKWRGNHESNQE